RAMVVEDHPAQWRGQKALAGLADRRARGEAKGLLRSAIEEHDTSGVVERDDGIHRRFDDAREPLLVLLQALPQLLQREVRRDAGDHLFVLERLGDVVDRGALKGLYL